MRRRESGGASRRAGAGRTARGPPRGRTAPRGTNRVQGPTARVRGGWGGRIRTMGKRRPGPEFPGSGIPPRGHRKYQREESAGRRFDLSHDGGRASENRRPTGGDVLPRVIGKHRGELVLVEDVHAPVGGGDHVQ